MKLVKNKSRKFGSATGYWSVWINGRPYLFTDHELDVAQRRADVNPEDIPNQGLLDRILDIFRRV